MVTKPGPSVVAHVKDDVVKVVDEDDRVLDPDWNVVLAAPNTAGDGEWVSIVIPPSEGMAEEDDLDGMLMDLVVADGGSIQQCLQPVPATSPHGRRGGVEVGASPRRWVGGCRACSTYFHDALCYGQYS